MDKEKPQRSEQFIAPKNDQTKMEQTRSVTLNLFQGLFQSRFDDNREPSPTGQTGSVTLNLFQGLLPSRLDDNRETTSPTGQTNIDRSRTKFGMTQSGDDCGCNVTKDNGMALIPSRHSERSCGRVQFIAPKNADRVTGSFANAQDERRAAFTLAEVLITLGIIGVVAALTLPMFMENMTERTNVERQVNIVQKITQATDKMRALDELGRFSTTEEFVGALKKHLKIAKICGASYSEPIENCWPTAKVTTATGEEFEIKNVKTSKNLDMKWEPETNAVGLVLADGANIILAYNPTNLGVNQSEAIKASKFDYVFKNGKTKTFMGYTTNTTGGMAFIMDVNGKSKPNSEKIGNTENDIRSFNGAMLATGCKGKTQGELCFYQPDTKIYVDCSSAGASSDDYKYCKPTPSGHTKDYWAGAKKACAEAGLELPDKRTLATYKDGNNPYGIDSGWFWSSSEYDNYYAYNVNLSDGLTSAYKSDRNGVLCVGN